MLKLGLLRCFLFANLVSASVAAERPNFVLINIDDLGYADVGEFGSKLNHTPNIDRLAAEGRKLMCFYAAPVCSPSRASLMTGCYPKRVGIPQVLFPGNAVGINSDEHTVPELLKQQGYTTACIGKWHLGDQPEFLPTRHGFDSYFGLPYSNDMGPAEDGVKSNLGEKPRPPRPGQAAGRGQPPLPLLQGDKVVERVKHYEQTTLARRYTEAAVSFIREHKEAPFFLYLPHTAVHFPLYPGKEFQGKSKNGLYGDWVAEVDWSVGQVVDAIRELKLSERTLVIFTSDNGGTPRAVNTPLRGNKASTWEGGMRTPTIAWWPGKIPGGTATDEMASMMDVLPTLVKLAGGTVPTDRRIDGRDMWPLLSGESKTAHDRFYFFRGENLEAVRSGSWKLHLKSGQLVNLQEDVGEASNVAEQHVEIVKQLQTLAEDARADLGDGQPGPGCRRCGRVTDARPIIAHDGTVRDEFRGPAKLE